MSRLDTLLTLFLALLFGFASVDKLAHVHGFVAAIDSYRILPIPMGSLLAPLVIAAELTIAVGLLRQAWRRRAALQAAIVTMIFTLAAVANRVAGEPQACGCWFSIDMPNDELHLLFNTVVIAMSLLVWHAAAPGASGRFLPVP